MGRHIMPLLIPIGAIAIAGVIIFVISRVLLAFSHETTPMVALGIALVVLLGCTLIASRVEGPQEVH